MVHVGVMPDNVSTVDCGFALAVGDDVQETTEEEDHFGARVTFIEYDRVWRSNNARCVFLDGVYCRFGQIWKRFHECCSEFFKLGGKILLEAHGYGTAVKR